MTTVDPAVAGAGVPVVTVPGVTVPPVAMPPVAVPPLSGPAALVERLRRPTWRAVIAALLIGGLITAALSTTSYAVDKGNERRLLTLQGKQAATVIGSAITGIVSPLQTALVVATETGGDPARFTDATAAQVGPGRTFVSAALWRVDGGQPTQVASAGSPPLLADVAPFAARAATSRTFVVQGLSANGQQRVAYGVGRSGSPFVVYAERAIPANRVVEVEQGSAFADLHFASYLGRTTSTDALQTTDVPVDRLPLTGTTVTESIPFGDTTLTLVAAPATPLGGALGKDLPWIVLGGGVLLTVVAAMVAGQLVRRRTAAEASARTIADLYDRLDASFAEQRSISETLQLALLPKSLPVVPELDVAARYVAGARGMSVGGDWYTLVRVGGDRFGFVVGDVSGRGVAAAAIMARLRFALRAYLLEGHGPSVALAKCSEDLDITEDGHLATVLVGVGELGTGEVTLANAGHPNPLLRLPDGSARFVETQVGRPLGVAGGSYPSTAVTLPPGSTLFAFTDGLVERRDEDIDEGLARLSAAAAHAAADDLDQVLADLLRTMTGDGGQDDIAVLALRRVGT